MSVSKAHILDRLRRVKGPDLEGNIVDLGLVSDILIKEDRVYFSITVPAARAGELESLRQAAEKVVREVEGVGGVVAVLTAENKPGEVQRSNVHEHPRVREARKRGMAGDGANGQHGAVPGPGMRQAQGVPGVKHLIAVASGKGGVGKSTVAANLALGFQAIGLK